MHMWAGGTNKQRNLVDLKLRNCIQRKAGSFHATIIYMGVTVGKYSPIKLEDKKWGNAWGESNRNQTLSNAEVVSLKKKLQESRDTRVTEELKSIFIKELIHLNYL